MRSLSLLLLLLPAVSRALLVAPSSPCAVQCGNQLESTTGEEITCEDDEYSSSTYGSAFETCINCELESKYVDPQTNMSDIEAAIYNMRFALSWCLFGWGGNTDVTNTQCITHFSCGPLEDAFESNLNHTDADAFEYCGVVNDNLISEPKCQECLSETGQHWYLSNFVTLVYTGCMQLPAPGTIMSFDGAPFSTTQLNMTNSTQGLPYSNGYSNGLSLGSQIGISVGAILLALFIAGFCIICNGRRRRRTILAEKARQGGYEWDPARPGHAVPGSSVGEHTPGGFFDSPQSQKPFAHSWGYPQDFKSAPSLNDSPISPAVGQNRVTDWQRDRKSPQDDEGEGIEMVGVGGIAHPPPMLQPSGMR